jgi:ABC-type enterochelin transport system permease subunit
MSINETFKGLPMGAKIVVVILSLVIGGYALAIIGLIVIGVMANTVISGDVTVPASTSTAVTTQLGNFETLVTTVLNPYTTIAALVVVAVLLAIFFKGKMPGSGSSVN